MMGIFFMPQLHRTTIESTIEGKTKNVYISQLKKNAGIDVRLKKLTENCEKWRM